jgi:uncharacterized protein
MAHEVVKTFAQVPVSRVRLTDGVFKRAHENNFAYLKSLSMDSILYWFRQKAGLPAPGEPYRGHFEDNIKGQSAGLYLMGAANSLRWQEDIQLRDGVNEVIDCIDACKEPDGFFEPIDKSEFGTKEYPNYVRVWLNYGLKAASLVGNPRALSLMRGMQTWFNRCDERVIAKDLMLGYQGMIANTTVYLSDAGLAEDLETTVDYYQENWWLAQFIRGDDGAVHKRPTPHGTELEAVTAYLDLYLATGKPLYLNAVKAAYRMFKQKWQHVGGGIVAIENTDIAPSCYWLDPAHKYNELCCTAHWIYLNQRLHLLEPNNEAYPAEIEKSLYNILIANQVGAEHIRYHAYIDLQKDGDRSTPVSCCAGLGTRLLGSLPEFLYSTAPDGLYVNLYSSSEITWIQDGITAGLAMQTDQPGGGSVRIKISTQRPVRFALRLRIPAWASEAVPIYLGDEQIELGTPGSYATLEREWRGGEEITLSFLLGLRVTKYKGVDSAAGFERCALEYGPLLLGLVGPLDFMGKYMRIPQDPAAPAEWLIPIPEYPGHFLVKGKPNCEYLPYYKIQEQTFSCYPVFG